MTNYPEMRLRRGRKTANMRDLVREITLNANDLILPLFVTEGENRKEEVKTLPNIYRYSIDLLLKEIEIAAKLGIKAIALFPQIDEAKKTPDCQEAFNEDNLICRTIRTIKKYFPEILIIADVALDPYNLDGHDGIIQNGEVDNDKTLPLLVKQALVQAQSGADIIAPSDMMDGRIGAIRKQLDQENLHNVSILSYAVKYASKLYGPFRDAVGSSQSLKGASKASYQMDFANKKEAILEAQQDLAEGADMLMVKPAGFYLDIIQKLESTVNNPIFAYQVSGELAMLKYASQAGCFEYFDILHENLIAIKRSGARAIFCYDAIFYLEKAKNL